MADPIISVHGLGKEYRLGATLQHDTLRDQIAHGFQRVFGKGAKEKREVESFWALKDVSFDVQPGEAIGIIGRNGAGKSTMLKVLSQITEPTEGEIRVRGRLASLLEVGTGFHPELSGRENIFLNGVILGMTKAEVRSKFDEIVAFAEVEKFLDTPVKRYSSGMYVRLAFAVAAHLQPEILVVDEVLAVGDANFQNKCLGKMGDVARSGGRTVLFVSHNMAAVQALCGRVVHLRAGQVAGIGDPVEQINAYLGDIRKPGVEGEAIPLTKDLEATRLDFNPDPVPSGAPVKLSLELRAKMATQVMEVAVLILSAHGARVAIMDFRNPRGAVPVPEGGLARWECEIDSLPLVEGEYRVGLFLRSTQHWGDHYDLATLTVQAIDRQQELAPYPAAYRGLMELDYRFKFSTGNG